MDYKNALNEAMDRRKIGISKAALEDAMAAFIGAKAAIALNSGAAAIRMALRLAAEEAYGSSIPVCSGKQKSVATGLAGERDSGMRPVGSLWGKRVFCPDLAPASLAYSILREDGEPIFIDISPCDWGMDPEALEIAFTLYPDVKIVLMTHLHGFPGQIREIKDVCARHGAVLIEDVSDALEASIGGRMAGSFGDYAILDFGKGRIVSGNTGGMLLWNGESGVGMGADGRGYFVLEGNRVAQDAKRARQRTLLPKSALPWVEHGELGRGCTGEGFHAMSEPLAMRILSELQHLPERIARKKEIYENYRELLDGDLMYMNPVGTGAEPNYWMPCITCESAIPFREWRTGDAYGYANPHGTSSPMEIHDALRASGIWSCPLHRPLSQQPAFWGCEQVSLDGSRQGFTGNTSAEELDGASLSGVFWECCDWSKQISKTGLCLPSDPGMTREEQERVAEIIYSCFDAWQGGVSLGRHLLMNT